MSFTLSRLGPADAERMRLLNALFAAAFDDPASYDSAPPGNAYVSRVLGDRKTIVLVAQEDEHIVGGLVAYVLDKLEQERREIYIYDLAVAEDRRRQGIATALIGELQAMAPDLGAWVIYVQADHGDGPAIALYEKLGTREDVMHFDIRPRAAR
ncbi:MAG TPA: AAC(3)-I family aminoglycoside N-acetyltransferase [Sphingomicrobium sp.]|nr:AAC(3)-I family aminoglycoside N-acetyltransferase [Sphingomicrobium sp.]